MPTSPGITPLPSTPLSRLQDKIDLLKAERDRLRTELAAAGGETGMRLDGARQLRAQWAAQVLALRGAANDPGASPGAAAGFRAQAQRTENMARQLEDVVGR